MRALKRLESFRPGFLLLCVLGLDAAFVESGSERFEAGVILLLRRPGHIDLPLGPAWMAEIGRDLSGLGSNDVLGLIVLTACGACLLGGFRRSAATLALASGSALVGNGLLKLLIQRVRPALVPDAPQVFTTSFPSSHSMVSAAVFFTGAALIASRSPSLALRRFVFVMAGVGTGLVGVSRVYLGVHWPTDVVAGWVAGLFCAWSSWRMMGRDPPRLIAAG